MAPVVSSWDEYIATYEAYLDSARRALASGKQLPVELAEMQPSEPVPEEYAARLLYLMASLACALDERSHPPGFVEAWRLAAQLVRPRRRRDALTP